MLQKIDCPSYIQTQQTSEDGSVSQDIAMIPWDQFHTLMTMVSENNRKVIEVNTLLHDWIHSEMSDDNFIRLIKRTQAYFEDVPNA